MMGLKLPSNPKQGGVALQAHFANSDELCEYMAEITGGVTMLAFSTGKDSVAAWLKLRRYFDKIVPYYLYNIPGNLDFIEKSLTYYEEWFGCHIIRLPHPSLYRQWNNLVFQAPENIRAIESAGLREYDYAEINSVVRMTDPALDVAYQAVGVRSADSIMRRTSILQHGSINHGKMRFFPVFDYKKDDIVRELDEANISLPIDYEWFGRTFDGIDYRFTSVLREKSPKDYEKVVAAFPQVELDILRQQWRKEYWEGVG